MIQIRKHQTKIAPQQSKSQNKTKNQQQNTEPSPNLGMVASNFAFGTPLLHYQSCLFVFQQQRTKHNQITRQKNKFFLIIFQQRTAQQNNTTKQTTYNPPPPRSSPRLFFHFFRAADRGALHCGDIERQARGLQLRLAVACVATSARCLVPKTHLPSSDPEIKGDHLLGP